MDMLDADCLEVKMSDIAYTDRLLGIIEQQLSTFNMLGVECEKLQFKVINDMGDMYSTFNKIVYDKSNRKLSAFDFEDTDKIIHVPAFVNPCIDKCKSGYVRMYIHKPLMDYTDLDIDKNTYAGKCCVECETDYYDLDSIKSLCDIKIRDKNVIFITSGGATNGQHIMSVPGCTVLCRKQYTNLPEVSGVSEVASWIKDIVKNKISLDGIYIIKTNTKGTIESTTITGIRYTGNNYIGKKGLNTLESIRATIGYDRAVISEGAVEEVQIGYKYIDLGEEHHKVFEQMVKKLSLV